MKKYKLLRFGKCYINKAGDFVIALLRGDNKHGYQFAGSHVNSSVLTRTFQLLSRIVPNDGNWKEIAPEIFNVSSALHITGHIIKFPTRKSNGKLPVITYNRMY